MIDDVDLVLVRSHADHFDAGPIQGQQGQNGQQQGGSFAEYALPSTDQVPPIETLIVEVPAPDGPFGAKGIGEPPVCGVPGAIANAITAACGARLTELPMSPLRVWRALQ